MFQVRCPLGHLLEIQHEHIGQRLMCPMCQAVVHVSPARPGDSPTAKYEIQCSNKHILRVKQKYLGKEVHCPSCQEKVSMHPSKILTASGDTLGKAKPQFFKKKKTTIKRPPPPAVRQDSQNKPPLKVAPPHPPVQDRITPNRGLPPVGNRATPALPPISNRITPAPPTVQQTNLASQRIPPPPKGTNPLEDSAQEDTPTPPLMAEIVEETFELSGLTPVVDDIPSPAQLLEEDQEFEVVDTQFHMELQESGVEVEKAPPVIKKSRSGRIPPPPELQDSEPEEEMGSISGSSSEQPPTGLHSLNTSEMIKVQHAALSDPESPTIQVTCPQGHLLEVEKQFRGLQIQCPLCKQIFKLANN
ncbi:MAG TPA: hypothetical protein PKD72_06215 [Gemmatales bacterium]|mgnify:CR=1 FL=1|nr:hypothetical protein [Gemmatales bacterium]